MDDLARVKARFAEFAAAFPDLRLYHRLAGAIADDDEVAALLLAARPGQRRPVLLLAALHELVLRRPDVAAAHWYPSATGVVADGDPWPDVRATLLAHRAELTAVIASRATQTNEVNRCVYLGWALAHEAPSPTLLVELGASAGLLLGVDRYRVEVGGGVLGDPDSPVVCAGVAPDPPGGLPPIVGRLGIDLDPVSLDDTDAIGWLRACLWPDVPGRVARFDAAVAHLRATGAPRLIVGDLVDGLADVAAAARSCGAQQVVVYTSWALTYVERSRRQALLDRLDAIASNLGRPVVLVTAEPDGAVPGVPIVGSSDTVLVRRRCGGNAVAEVLGTCHPHGEWVR